MAYTVVHRLAETRSRTRILVDGDVARARFSEGGPINIAFPGRIERWASAVYFVRVDDGSPSAGEAQRKTLSLTTTIRTPDGTPFEAEEVTLADLQRYRNLRGVPRGPWTYSVVGESEPVVTDGGVSLVPSDAHVRIRLHEVVHSSSAPPLVETTVPEDEGASLPLDLFHVGRLEVVASAGSPVTATPFDDDRLAFFLANPQGGIYTASGTPPRDFGGWSTVSEGSTTPGGRVTPCDLGDGRIALFVADPGGGVYSCVGSPSGGYGPWRTAAEGGTLPGASICAMSLGSGRVRLLVAGTSGVIYTLIGKPPDDWGGWELVSEGSTVPGGPISAVQMGGRLHAFVAERAGGVYTASLGATGPWSAWEPVADGATIPGGHVCAVGSPNGRMRVIVADRGGGIWTSTRRDEVVWGGWTEIPGVRTLPGAPIGAVPVGENTIRIALADHSGGVRSTVGSAGDGWGPWEHVSEGATIPGGPVTTVRHPSGRVSLVVADRGLGVYAATLPSGSTDWSGWNNVSEGGVGGRPRQVRLLDPDGVEMASSATGYLSLDADLRLLHRSRDANGGVRNWSLEVAPLATPAAGAATAVNAQVVATTRLPLDPVNDRIDALLGVSGEKFSLTCDTTNGRGRLRLTVLDRVTAATLDFHGALDSVLEGIAQDEGVGTDIQENVAYNLVDANASVGYGIVVDLDGLSLSDLRVDLGAAENLPGGPFAVRVSLRVGGQAVARLAGFPLATASPRREEVAIELGLGLGADGEFASSSWISGGGSLVDVDVHWAAAIAAGVVSALGTLTAGIAAEAVESWINSTVEDTVGRLAATGLEPARHMFAKFLGADFTYLSCRVEGADLVLAHLAAIEPQPTPSPLYRAAVGREVTQADDGHWEVAADERGDTWANANLLAKIDHIVVVMMENRSYDHVLGHLAAGPAPVGDGLDPELTAHLAGLGTPTTWLGESNIIPTDGVGLKTRFPCPVGHSLDDVAEQLAQQMTLASTRKVSSPSGFLSNFAKRLAKQSQEVRDQVVVGDVLGHYRGDDLAFFRHLTTHYAWSDRFYCSHPGPTLPNRMLSLVGDVQYTRSGEAVLDNNHGEEFYLSRAMTIFDLLTRYGVPWRVYESFPSVTMLRMFGRYAADKTSIVPVASFAGDVLDGNLPSVTVVDPAMHHKPQTDDHPVADMHRGQIFLDSVYRALRANPITWPRTLLLITYDEHGGFYDHVIPPVAEILDDGSSQVVIPFGVRVPTFAVSPWVPAGLAPPVVLDHTSILKTVLARFCGDTRPFLSDRVHAASSFESYLTAAAPRTDVPMPPVLAQPSDTATIRSIITDPVFRRDMRSGNVDYHELTGMLARDLGRDAGA